MKQISKRARVLTGGAALAAFGVGVFGTVSANAAGHAEYTVTSGGQLLIAFGDALHSPIQVDHPEWPSTFDHDPVRSADRRRRLVAELEDPDTIGFGIHFADATFGHVRRDGRGPAWRPLDL
ncbi:hypothetical protein ACFVZD_28465 [Streptomyces sp. NPDC058287]|uniref:hypothetical protein n=1 Tax=unclassified Streptomyces TaxID=2593676 RepID=UPI0036ECECA6